MHTKEIIQAGLPVQAGNKVLIMVHGRGGTAADILGLATHLSVQDFSLLAPQATNHTWYPFSFLAPREQNEPWLSSALDILTEMVSDLNQQGIPSENIYFLGFSQGACLTLEFVTRYAQRYGGVVAFTGGLIGKTLDTESYQGDFKGTPVFIGTADPDPHVPVERVNQTETIVQSLHANVLKKVYKGIGHTIVADEIAMANEQVFSR